MTDLTAPVTTSASRDPDCPLATAAQALGIAALTLGFLLLPLAGGVAANVLGSVALQRIDAAGGRLGGRRKAVTGMACATAGLVLWGTVFVVAAAVSA